MGELEIEYQPYSSASMSAFPLKRINGPGTAEWLLKSICQNLKGDVGFFHNFASEIMFLFQNQNSRTFLKKKKKVDQAEQVKYFNAIGF